MSIDRRKAILALMGTWVAMVSGQKKKDPDSGSISYTTGPLTNPPSSINFDVDSFTGFTFNRKGATITLTPDEIWGALGGKL